MRKRRGRADERAGGGMEVDGLDDGYTSESSADGPSAKHRRLSMAPLQELITNMAARTIDPARVLDLFDSRYAASIAGWDPPIVQGTDVVIAGPRLALLAKDFGWPGEEPCTYFALRYVIGGQNALGISRLEWLQAMVSLQAQTLDEAKRALVALQLGLRRDRQRFAQYFNQVFRWLNPLKRRCIDLPVAQQALASVLGPGSPFTASFCRFLSEGCRFRGLNADQWRNFLSFSLVITPDFANYDENDAWPSMLDEYVDWMRSTGRITRQPEAAACGAIAADGELVGHWPCALQSPSG